MSWLRPSFVRRRSRPNPVRRARPALEALECRLAPAGPPVPTADLGVEHHPNTFLPAVVGNTTVFDIHVHNDGPDPATGVVAVDTPPVGLTFTGAAVAEGTFDHTTGVWTIGNLAAGTEATMTIFGRVDTFAPLVDSVTVHGNEFDPMPSDNTSTVTVTPAVPPGGILRIAQTVDHPSPLIGDVVHFTVTLTNVSTPPVTGLRIADALPAGLTFVGAAQSLGSYDPTAGTWAVPTLAPGTVATLTLSARVAGAGTLQNTATISAADQPAFDPRFSSASASVRATVPADLRVTQPASGSAAVVGQVATFAVQVTNAGPNPATGVAVTDAFPAGLTFTGASPARGSFNAATGVWTVGNVGVGESVLLTLFARVDTFAALTNTVTVHGNELDPNPADNTSTVTVTPVVPAGGVLRIAQTVSDPAPMPGGTVRFTVKLSNVSSAPVTGVRVADALPAGLTLTGASASVGTYDPITGTWAVGTLAGGAVVTLTLTARVDATGTRVNTATIIAADQPAFDPSNASASASTQAAVVDLSVSVAGSTPAATLGVVVSFAAAVSNRGPDAATQVLLSNALPAGLTFLQSIASQGTYTAATGSWAVGGLAPGATATLQILARVDQAGAYVDTAVATSRETETNPADSAAEVALVVPGVQIPKIAIPLSNPGATVSNGVPAVTGLGKRSFVATGAVAGSAPLVQVFDLATGLRRFGFLAYDPAFSGGVNVALADVNGDGVPDIITAPASGGRPLVQVFDGVTGALLNAFWAYDPNFVGGVNLAAAVGGQGAVVVTAPAAGGVPLVNVFQPLTGKMVRSFFAFDQAFTGGVNVAAADLNGDGVPDIVAAPAAGGAPQVRVFDGASGALLNSFYAFDPSFTGGVSVAATSANGRAVVAVGAGVGGVPGVNTFDALQGKQIGSFVAFTPTFRGGVTVAAADLNGDGVPDFVVAPASGGVAQAQVYDGAGGTLLDTLAVGDPTSIGGVHVAAR